MIARGILKGVLVVALVDAILFGVAGRIDWPAAWILTGVWLIYFVIVAFWMVRNAPDLLEERITAGTKAPRWDTVIVGIYTILLFALLITAALDAGRFRWSRIPLIVQAVAGVGAIAAGAIIAWCAGVNRFLSSRARIQNDRQQQVVQEGPYRFVRHPMYAAIIVLMLCIAVGLGSWFALIPAIFIGVLFVIRSLFEDRMLRAGLSEYAEYAKQVRYRLLPGLW